MSKKQMCALLNRLAGYVKGTVKSHNTESMLAAQQFIC